MTALTFPARLRHIIDMTGLLVRVMRRRLLSWEAAYVIFPRDSGRNPLPLPDMLAPAGRTRKLGPDDVAIVRAELVSGQPDIGIARIHAT